MRTKRLNNVLGHLRQTLLPPDGGGLSDGQLLTCFIADREEAAFAALVRRHGPMVLGVCRRLLHHEQDAEDAFQATFLVLARKAASVVRREALAGFLYGVAYRTALRARMRVARRRVMERPVEDMPHPEVPPAEAPDWRPLLDHELGLLPDHFRTAIILCDLECKTRREAARQLGLSEGTLSSRLARARRLLARRLARYGLALSGGALAAALAEGGASAAVPARLVGTTIKAAALVAAGRTAGAATPAAVLMNEVLRAMLMTKLKVIVAVAVVAVTLGVGGVAFRAAGQDSAEDRRAEAKPLTDLELLSRDVEILKLQVDVLQQKMRAQDRDLRKLKGEVALIPRTPATQNWPAQAAPLRGASSYESLPTIGGTAENPPMQGPPGATVQPSGNPAGTGRIRQPAPAGADPEKEAEAALKALREGRDDENTRRQAVEALERALQRLKEREKSHQGGQKH
jgi:RNA polymerase sigma factor (sigma-70 family)